MKRNETIYRMALTRIPGLGIAGARNLLKIAGSASRIFEERESLRSIIPGLSKKIFDSLYCPETLRQCESELQFAEKNRIACLTEADEAYPSRLRECPDAPLVLFYRGTADLNKQHIISIVGTRNATEYGKELCFSFLKNLQKLLPDTLVISGLAYGIDIQAHRAALQYGLETIAVLAHGLDRIYPPIHRNTAAEMTEHGGVITEFPERTRPERQNFIKRNRIIAGLSDATIVVESAEKGGSLITADIANSYNRDCFAFPGRTNDPLSAGCNNLIRNNQATLLQGAEEFIKAMNWDKSAQQIPETVQRQLFPDLSPDEEFLVSLIGKHPEGIQLNTLIVESNIAINHITTPLFELEMKGIIRTLAGGIYKLI